MLTKPDIPDSDIIDFLNTVFDITIESLSFLPIGADFHSVVYKTEDTTGSQFFLKLRSGNFNEASILVPHYFSINGLQTVISPIPTKNGRPFCNFKSYIATLYPYIEGKSGVEANLSRQQWSVLGASLKSLHATTLPQDISELIPRENFSPTWRSMVKNHLNHLDTYTSNDQATSKTIQLLLQNHALILNIIERTEALAESFNNKSLKYCPCHSDIHGWNVIVDNNGSIFIVDWDALVFAPKERDLMFIGAGIECFERADFDNNESFYEGYGKTDIDKELIAYYRYERIIEDIAEYCNQIFQKESDVKDKEQSFKYLGFNFLPNGTISRAKQADPYFSQRNC